MKSVKSNIKYQVCKQMKRQDNVSRWKDTCFRTLATLPPCRIYLTGDSRMENRVKSFRVLDARHAIFLRSFRPIFFIFFTPFLSQCAIRFTINRDIISLLHMFLYRVTPMKPNICAYR